MKKHPAAHRIYAELPERSRKEFLDFCTGKTSLYLCYDTFFHFVFDADIHKKRVEGLISALLGQDIQIIEVLPREGL